MAYTDGQFSVGPLAGTNGWITINWGNMTVTSGSVFFLLAGYLIGTGIRHIDYILEKSGLLWWNLWKKSEYVINREEKKCNVEILLKKVIFHF